MTWIYIIIFISASFTPTNPEASCLCDDTQNYITSIDSLIYEQMNRGIALQLIKAQKHEINKLYPPVGGNTSFKMLLDIKLDSIQQ